MPKLRRDVFAAINDPTRREILSLLADDALPVGALTEHFKISRPAVSQPLAVLAEAGLVSVRPDGNRRLYRARTEALAPVSAFIDEMWSDRLRDLKRVAEEQETHR